MPTGKPADDPAELRNILLSFGKQEFLKKFGFQWKETLTGSDIPGYTSKMVPRVYNVLFDFTAVNPARKLIEDRVGLGAFKWVLSLDYSCSENTDMSIYPSRKDGWEFPWKPKDLDKYKPVQGTHFY